MPIDTDMHPRQREYNIHASKIKSMRAFELGKILAPKRLNGKQVKNLLDYLKGELPYDMLASLEDNLKQELGDDTNIHIHLGSLVNYLRVLPCAKIRASPISFDDDTGKITVWYNSDRADYNSVKVSLIPNEHDFTFSLLSRAGSIAVMSGVLKLHPQGLYKIEAFMNTTLEVAIATDSHDDTDAGM